jgi:hypothetical protein
MAFKIFSFVAGIEEGAITEEPPEKRMTLNLSV